MKDDAQALGLGKRNSWRNPRALNRKCKKAPNDIRDNKQRKSEGVSKLHDLQVWRKGNSAGKYASTKLKDMRKTPNDIRDNKHRKRIRISFIKHPITQVVSRTS